MDAEKVRIGLHGGELRIHVPPNSDLLNAGNRIYLANILGLEPSEEFLGYSLPSSRVTPQVVQEILRHCDEEGIEKELDSEASTLLATLQRQEAELDASRVAGLAAKTEPVTEIEVPGFQRQLKSYQVPAVAHLLAVGNGANFSVPGSGKTTMVLAALATLRANNVVQKLIVVCPRSAFMPWEEEFTACFQRKPNCLRIVGPKASRQRLYDLADQAELVLLTYQMATNDAEDLARLLRRHKSLLVLDESHNIKRLAGGKWAEALIGVAPFAERRAVLSGTPVPNSLVDLWSQMAFLWPASPILGPRELFKSQAEASIEDDSAHVRDTLKPFYWRVKKADLKLTKPTFKRISVPMGQYQAAIYRALAAKVLSDVVGAPADRARLHIWRRARMIRMLQAASNPTLLTEYSTEFRIPPLSGANLAVDQLIEKYYDFEVPTKLDATARLVRRLFSKGEKVLVWSAFVHNIKTLRDMLSDLAPDTIFGEIPRDASEDEDINRERIIRDFKVPGIPKVLIANPGACAESISLHKVCHHAIYLDRTFNAAHYMQSLDRIHRVGLDPGEKVYYYIIQADDTIDTAVDERLEAKKSRMLKILDDDFATLDFESPADVVSDASDEDADFAALIESLKATVKVS